MSVDSRPEANIDFLWWLMIAAGGMAVAGSLAPWGQVATILSVAGTEREGWLTASVAVAAIVALVVSQRFPSGTRQRVAGSVVALLAGIAIAVISGYDWTKIDELHTKIPGESILGLLVDTKSIVSSSWGVWMTTTSGALIAVCGLIRIGIGFYTSRRSERPASPVG